MKKEKYREKGMKEREGRGKGEKEKDRVPGMGQGKTETKGTFRAGQSRASSDCEKEKCV